MFHPPGKKLLAVFAVVVVLALVVYVGSYVTLSSQGRYEPAVIGLHGVKWYSWAPQGFVTDYKWNHRLVMIYAPLHWLDQRLWHTSDKADSGDYPVNTVEREDVGKVYQAWGALD